MVEDYRVLNAVASRRAAGPATPVSHRRAQRVSAAGIPRHPPTTSNGDADAGNLFRRSTPTVWDALRDIPEADDYEELLHRDWVKARFKKSTDYSAPLRGDEDDPDDYSGPREFDSSLLTSSLRTIHTDLSKKRFRETQPGDTEPVSRFHKLDPEGRLQYDSRRDRQRSRRVYFAAADTPVFAALHHRARSGAPALLSRLVPLSRHEVARLPADRQFRAAAACQGGRVEGPRSVLRLPKSPIAPSPRATTACCRSICRTPRSTTACRPTWFRSVSAMGQGGRSQWLRRTDADTPKKPNRYSAIIGTIFKNHYKPGKTQFEFSRDEFVEIAKIARASPSRRIWATPFTPFGSEPLLPDEIVATAGKDREWVIELAGRANIASDWRNSRTSYRTRA